jgi:Flp pilus assembly protein TadG
MAESTMEHSGAVRIDAMMADRQRLKLRKGATLVLAAVLILVVGGMAAFGIELARIYSGVNEMQTGADAGALAGAHRLQKQPGASVVSHVQSFASSNSAFGAALSIPAGDVEGGFWNPSGAGTFTTGAWSTANAVRVWTRSTRAMAFGRLLGRTSLTANRSGVAWVANQATRDCIKPWGFDMTFLNGRLGQSLTTQAGVNALGALVRTTAGQYSMTVIAGPPENSRTGNTPQSVFLALTGGSSSRKDYQNAIIGLNCEGSADYTVGTNDDHIQPGGGGGDVPRTTARAVELNLPGNQGNGGVATCASQVGNDATCRDPITAAEGVTVTVAAVTQVSANSATLNILMDFRLMCVFRGTNGPGTSRPAETCPWLTAAGVTANNYEQGTLVGYPMPSIARNGSGNTLGNTLSTAQKLVLVR